MMRETPSDATLPDETYLDFTIARTACAALDVRDAVDKLYLDVPRGTLPTARLLCAELAANAVRHGGGDFLRLVVARRGGALRVEVIDGGDGFEPPPRDPRAFRGRGLELVDTLASRWGVERGSTHVWFELPLGPA